MKRTKRATGSDEGFTLVEMLIALVILGFVMMAMASVAVGSFGSVRSSNAQAVANQVANEVIEELRSRPFDSVSPPGTSTQYSPVLGQQTVKGTTFTPTATVLWVNDPCNGPASGTTRASYDYLRFNVVVAWSVKGTAKSVTVDSFRRPGNLYRSPLSTIAEPQQSTVRVESCP